MRPATALPDDVLDQAMVAALRAFGREPGKLLRELAEAFVVEALSLMADIERAVDGDDFEAAARSAHRMKGASGHIGAFRVAAAAAECQTVAEGGAHPAIAAATIAMRAEVELAVAAVRLLP